MGLQHSFSGDPDIPDPYEHEGFSIMSYTRDPGPTLENAYSGNWKILNSDELAILDVVALQAIWGAKLDGNMGDTSYGTTTAMTRTIVDGGGNDTIDLGDWQTDKMNAIIDLGRGGLSEVGRDTSGTPEFLRFAIDYNSDIENLIAPATTETNVTGNDLANSIMATEVFGEGGFAAADHFEGLGGNDTLSGYTGDDTLWGGADDDELFGGSGADTVMGNEGSDALDGGTGNDLLAGDAMSLQEVWDELAAAGMSIA
jgi:Ca2+-binding RTX toxin-like protein